MTPTSSKVRYPNTRLYNHSEYCVSADGTFMPFANFKFAGDLRPRYPLSPKRAVPPEIPRPDYAEHGTVRSFLRGAWHTL